MEEKRGIIQVKMLKAIYKNGGTANTKEIYEIIGLSPSQSYVAGIHLVNRSLIIKKRGNQPNGLYSMCVYKLREQTMNKTKRLIKEYFNEDVN